MFGLFSIFYSFALFLNAVVVLDNKRVLAPLKLPLDPEHRNKLSSFRKRIVELINLTRTMFEFPLLIINCIYILYEMFLG